MSKRYVLFEATAPLTDGDVERLAVVLAQKRIVAKVIPIKGNPLAVIVKTTNAALPDLRGLPDIALDGTRLVSVLTSGAIGNLKKRARGAGAIGQVPQ